MIYQPMPELLHIKDKTIVRDLNVWTTLCGLVETSYIRYRVTDYPQFQYYHKGPFCETCLLLSFQKEVEKASES